MILGTLRMSARGVLLLSVISASFALAGCGQKGPLFLPSTPAAKAKPVPPVVENDSEVPTQPVR